MNIPLFSRIGRILILASVLIFLGAVAQAKLIRLRNQVLPAKVTAEDLRAAKSGLAQAPVSGLFLVQFTGPPKPEWRAQLAAAGVDLLHYVPEDTFVTRFRGVPLARVRAFPFVSWVGEYRAEYKVHRALTTATPAFATAQSLDVAVLLVPGPDSAELAGLKSSFLSIRQESSLRVGTILRGKVAPAQLTTLSQSGSVLWIESARDMKLVDEVASKIVAGDGGSHTLFAQSLGYDGSGVKVAVADSGLNNGDAASMHPDLLGRTPAFFQYGTLTDAADEHSHGTHVSGIIAGNGATGETDGDDTLYGLGVAPGASIIAQRIFDGVGGYEPPPSFERLTRDATRAGAVIGSNSWGDDTQGRYDVSAMEFDELVRDADALQLGDQQYILEFSAGNAGPGSQTVGSPAVAKNVIATGACENNRPDFIIYADGPDTMADFSSRGPCEDGRIKPDIVAPGTWISSLQSESATDQYAWAAIDDFYQYQGGTSQAGPHASGAAAVFVQYYRATHTNSMPTPALVKAALINTAVDMDDTFGTDPVPNMDEGWGRLDLTPFFDSARGFDFINQTVLLTNTQVFERHLVIASPAQPFRATLAYTDPPGFPGAIPALVNDLDLEVIAPDGHLYRGNQFDSGESVPDAPNSDRINNVESVYLAAPLGGDYIVRVRGRSVVEDVHGNTNSASQDFALVISGQLPVPGVGVVSLDRATYSAPGKVNITLIDSDQAGHPTATVSARSLTESAGESMLLMASGPNGVFTGAIATATGPPLVNGRLEITNRDTLTVSYFDVSSGSNQFATARADLAVPVLTNVAIANSFGHAIVSWTSDEPATSIVRYGTNATLASLTLSVTNSGLDTDHSVSLNGLTVGRTYYCCVVSADAAGNTATNSHNGALYPFVAPAAATVLVLDEFGTDPLSGTTPPISGYTDPLDHLGISYDLLVVSTNFTLNTLQPYRTVFWRVPELASPGTAGERTAVSNYVQGGGSLLLASMEVLSRLEEATATAFTHNVLHVGSYVVDPNSTGAAEIIGSDIDPITTGLDITTDFAVYEDLWSGYIGPDVSDTITPGTNASAILRNDFGDVVGLRWPGLGQQAPGRVVFFSFPLDAVPLGSGVNDRINLVQNVLSFLAPGAAGQGAVAFDSPAYGLPSVATVQVGDSDLAGQGTLNVTARSTTQTNAITIALSETGNQGIFSGSFAVIAATNSPTSGKVRAQNGDTLRVDYFDASANKVVTGRAQVDTMPPGITNVASEPDYVQATVYWDTSEPADSLVQFGESPLLGRTAHDSGLVTSHAVTLPALVPDRTYFYRVVSRDAAGNTATDDKAGKLYAFHTLLPLFPPWSDNMNKGATNWSVIDSDGSQSTWTLGTPGATPAHSPPAAWGSNLGGGYIDASETFLISPAIYLTNGNTATLSFWHWYDFTDYSGFDIEQGELQIVSSDTGAATTLDQYSDVSFGWENPTYDLTPYVGQVVYFAWHYFLFSFEPHARPGWLVDDVSVTVSNVPPGVIQITNNLWQTTYVLSGQIFLNGNGLGTVISNAPPGQYILEFADVPYYQTPVTQTNTLAPGGIVLFQGNYTFADANSNGIPDAFELRFFGTVSTNRTHLTDTDGDGMSDYAEFIAGTDPINPPRKFSVKARRLSGSLVRVEWDSVAGQQYRLDSSTNLLVWSPFSSWQVATGQLAHVDVPIPAGSVKSFFKVEAWTTNSPSGLASDLRISSNRLPNGSIQLSWTSSSGHGYQVQSSTNRVVWTPASSWIRATSSTTSYTLPASAGAGAHLYRVQVLP